MSDEYPWRDKERLERLYHEEGMSILDISKEFGCSHSTVSEWMDRLGVDKRSFGEENREYPQLWDGDWLMAEYLEKERTAPDIAEEIGCSEHAVLNAVEKQGIPKHSQGISKKSIHPSFDYNKGYLRVSSHNYDNGKQTGTDTVRIHRLVAIAKYGFDKVMDNIVHHKNGVKWDNRPENLEVMSQSEHMKEHYQNPNLDNGGVSAND